MINYQTITIDLQPDYREPVVQMYLSERDVGRPIQVNVLMQGQPYSFTAGTTVHIDLRKPSGHVVQVNGNYAVGSNVVLFNVVEQMAAEPGMCLTELSIVGDGQDPIGSKNWLTKVELSPMHAGDPSETWIEDLDELVQDAMEGHIDATLSIPGDAADAAAVGEELADLKSALAEISGITPEIKDALMAMFRYAVYKDGYSEDMYDRLYSALYEERTLRSISATFEQGENIVANTDSLDSLKQYLTVTALYSDGITETVEGYTLSGTLNSAESEITAAYSGKTDTFSVNVSILPSGYTHYNCVVADGTQYMDSGLSEVDMQDCGIKLKEAVTQFAESSGHVFSSRNFYSPFLWINSTLSSRNVSANRFGNQIRQQHNYERWALNEQHELTAYMNGGNGISLDGEEIYTLEKGTSTPSASDHFYFFAYGGNLSSTRYPLRGKLYYLKIYSQTGTLIHEYVPCTNGTNVAGLYDTIGGAFYSSETSTALSVE